MCKKLVDFNAAEVTYETSLKQLEAQGFSNKKKNLKLLSATNGDVEVVKNFLVARENLRLKRREQCMLVRATKKLAKTDEKFAKRLERKDKKKERREKNHGEGRRDRKQKVESNENSNGSPVVQEEKVVGLIKPTEQQWPIDVAHLYLDGNNMLYVVGAIRSLVLKRKSAAAESALETFARSFARALNLKHCTLVFDDTRKSVSEENFSVCSARPTFTTSDDALVEWAKACEHPAVYVTSDRELLHRLNECGGKAILCKPKEWFYYAANVLAAANGEKVENLDDWMAKWMIKNHPVDEIAKSFQDKLNL